MTLVVEVPYRKTLAFTRGQRAAFVVLLTGALCVALSASLPWLAKWPDSMILPATRWIGIGLTWLLEWFKGPARLFSWALDFPMKGTNWLLVSTPWPLLVALVAALAFRLGGIAMLVLAICGLGFVLASGYWIASMNTLALVVVSVPLALVSGLVIGILAYEVPRLKPTIQTLLDVMQTVPTFAYLTPLLLLFGFGPVVGLVASAIYAAPPMARNVLLGLDRVEPEVKEAARMCGGKRWQELFLVELPTASRQIFVGINQSLMAALSMVIIAAVIGGFNDIGWEVLMTMRKAEFGQSLIAGMVIVVFAILIDRISGQLAIQSRYHDWRVAVGIIALGAVITLIFRANLPASEGIHAFDGVANLLDAQLGAFTKNYGAILNTFKNDAMYFVLLPIRIGLGKAVLPMTWGFQWTTWMSLGLYAAAIAIAVGLAIGGRMIAGLLLVIAAGVLVKGVAQLPWPFVLVAVGAIAWVAGGTRLAIQCSLAMAVILLIGLWDKAMLSLYLSGIAVISCVIVGGLIGLLCSVSPIAWKAFRPICDMLQTIPLFVFLIPVLMFFQIGEFSAFLAICFYAVVPMIRYTQHGITSTPHELVEAAVASGATPTQIMFEVRIPYAVPTMLLGLNQTILYAFSMLVIAALIGTTELGQSIYLALGQANVGLGIASGASMAILALVADRLVQAFALKRRRALGL